MITLGLLRDSLPAQRFERAELLGAADTVLHGLAYDSRRVAPGTLFVALGGQSADGHDYISAAIASGASAVVAEHAWLERANPRPGVPVLAVENTRRALPYLASTFYGHPSQSLHLIGVTGTNGKTSVTYMIDSIMRAAGRHSAVLGTVGVQIDGKPVETHWTVSTTPEAADLQAQLAEFVRQAVECVAMEVTSIAIDQERTACCAFDTVVFTNLTQDHLDYHGTLEEYARAKERLFSEYILQFAKPGCNASINIDDPFGERCLRAVRQAGGTALTYGIRNRDADLVAEIGQTRATSTEIVLHERAAGRAPLQIGLNVGGLFNVSNALAAIGVARLRGIDDDAIRAGLGDMAQVPGRFEAIRTFGHGFDVIVDYAHTPDGLENVLRSARRLSPKRLIVVFGCGGNRDKKKRPIMGKIAVDLADRVFVTSDNPRKEDPGAIIADILAGIDHASDNPKVVVEPDRRAAIEAAVASEAHDGDLVVIAGKGHETYQLVGDQVLDFDDRRIAAEVLSR